MYFSRSVKLKPAFRRWPFGLTTAACQPDVQSHLLLFHVYLNNCTHSDILKISRIFKIQECGGILYVVCNQLAWSPVIIFSLNLNAIIACMHRKFLIQFACTLPVRNALFSEIIIRFLNSFIYFIVFFFERGGGGICIYTKRMFLLLLMFFHPFCCCCYFIVSCFFKKSY